MKKSAKWMLGLVAAFAMVACSAQNDCKFNVKEYAEGKTERLDEVVDLTDAQEKEVYALYLEQGKQIQKSIKQMKKEGFDHKRPEGAKKADCPKGKPECDKANCDKKADCPKGACDKANCEKKAACDKKAECTKCDKAACDKKSECKKAECPKAECKKAACEKKADCKKAECGKANCEKKAACDKANCDKKAACKKANCDKKAACDKVNCDKKANCEKKSDCKKAACDKKAECDKCPKGHKPQVEKPAHPRHPRHMVNPAERKAFFEKLSAILTPEQQQILKTKMMERKERRGVPQQAPQCCPTQNTDNK